MNKIRTFNVQPAVAKAPNQVRDASTMAGRLLNLQRSKRKDERPITNGQLPISKCNLRIRKSYPRQSWGL